VSENRARAGNSFHDLNFGGGEGVKRTITGGPFKIRDRSILFSVHAISLLTLNPQPSTIYRQL
jgi:hypothetical protein